MIKTHEIKSILTLALPLVAAFLAQKFMQLIDTLMMGWLGPEALAAGALGTSVFFTLLVFCMGTISATGIFIARAKGANDMSDVTSGVQNGLFLALLLSLPSMLLIWLTPHFLYLLGQNAKIIESVTLLVHALVWGIPGYLLFLTLREFISAFSLTRIVMSVTLLSLPLTFILNYILIYGKYGLPQLGIAGIGYAGSIILWFMFICLWIYSKHHPLLKPYISLDISRLDWNKIQDMFFIGAPSGALFVLESGMFLTAVVMMGYFGVDSLAAYQIAMQCASIAYSLPFALSMATALLVGNAIGGQDILQAKRFAFICLGIALFFSCLVAILFISVPELLIKFFLKPTEKNYGEIIQLATSFLIIASLFQCVDATQAIANGALRGFRDTFVPMLISIGCYWLLGIFSAYYLSFHTRLGPAGIWYGLVLGLFSAGSILLFRLYHKTKQYRVKNL